MAEQKRRFDNDDILAPRKHVDTDHVISVERDEIARPKPDFRDRIVDALEDRFGEGVGGDEDPPPGTGPAHPVEVDIDRPILDAEDRDVIENPIDAGDEVDVSAEKDSGDAHLDYVRAPRTELIEEEGISILEEGGDAAQALATGRRQHLPLLEDELDTAPVEQAADGFALDINGENAGFALEAPAEPDPHYILTLEDCAVGDATEADGFAVQIDGENAGLVDEQPDLAFGE